MREHAPDQNRSTADGSRAARLATSRTARSSHRPLDLQRKVGNHAVLQLLPEYQKSGDKKPKPPGKGGPKKEAPATEEVGTGLWATDAEGNPLPPSLEDISQGGLNDCFLFAAMAAIVNTNPQKIVDMIEVSEDGTKYTVTFEGIGIFTSATQTVTADFVVGKRGNVGPRGAFWPLIIEKAYAQQKGGLEAIDKGGNPGSAVDDMLNVGPSRFNPRRKTTDYIMGKVLKAKKEKWPMTILAPKKEGASPKKKAMVDDTSGLYFWHAYAIVDVDAQKDRIKLFNPWGRDHPNGDGWIDVADVRNFFIEININD